MGLRTDRRRGRVSAALALLALAAALDGWQLWDAGRWNARIADGSVAAAEGRMPGEALFAKALLVADRDPQAALGLYKEVEHAADPALARAAHYNAANLVLRRGFQVRESEGAPQALPLLELAKEEYRQVLRADPGHWDARYNLERALRALPDLDAGETAALPPPLNSERALTTMRAVTLGLP